MLIIRVVKGNERCASKQVKLFFFTLSVVLLVHFISFPFGGFETAAPCKGNMSKMGQRPSTHTGAYRLNVLGAISVERIGRNTPIYIVSPTHTNPQFTPVVSRGVAPISTYCPYRAPRLQNLRGALSLVRPALPWAEIPLPLQGATVSKPSRSVVIGSACFALG